MIFVGDQGLESLTSPSWCLGTPSFCTFDSTYPPDSQGGWQRTVLEGAEKLSFWSSISFSCMTLAKSFYSTVYCSYLCKMGIIIPSLLGIRQA